MRGEIIALNSPIMKVYKVLSQKDKWFSGKFDPDLLEKALNAYAQQGWQVVQSVTASMSGIIGSNREEIIIILERDTVTNQNSAIEAMKRQTPSPPPSVSPTPFKNPASRPTSKDGEPEIYTL
jgi:Domain of unknown function (DUF4177)